MSVDLKAALNAANSASPFNRHFAFEVGAVGEGAAEVHIDARAEAFNHAATLHAGVTAALLDTAAGYAAATVAGNVVTVGLTVNYMAAARGPKFIARASVVKAGQRQVFVDARLFEAGEPERLTATASVILTRI